MKTFNNQQEAEDLLKKSRIRIDEIDNELFDLISQRTSLANDIALAKDYLGNTCEFHEKSFIHMEPSEYNLTMSSEYRGFLNLIYGVKEDSW